MDLGNKMEVGARAGLGTRMVYIHTTKDPEMTASFEMGTQSCQSMQAGK